MKVKKDDESSKNKSWLSINLMLKIQCVKVKTQYKFFVLNHKKEKIGGGCPNYNESSDAWLYYLFNGINVGCGISQFIKIEELLQKKNEFIENETLTVGIELIVYDEYMLSESIIKKRIYSKRKISDDNHDVLNIKKRCEADKYRPQSLKQMCEYSLCKTLNFENAIRIMILADRHDDKQLKELAIDYVIKNFKKFKETEEFTALEQTQMSLFLVILKKSAAVGTI
ncbi:uncharacterized protein LOC123272744 [Cotesia glomerata]|uniref:uncharacterized protein LOC123272744 n=1 Tax=Cotesia glomerata TaxID=32391 RepID=UPI001D01F21D|nr:uncharacterized protein LOC123272744 [Cotesia glomerata]